jgi:hypothetical protein
VAVAGLAGFIFVGSGRSLAPPHALALGDLTPLQQRIVSGFARTELSASGGRTTLERRDTVPASGDPPCNPTLGTNIGVNRNCLNVTDLNLQGRGQAENTPAIAVNPLGSLDVVAGYNDFRSGDQSCGSSYSLNAGLQYSDSTVPAGFTRGAAFGGVARQYWQVGGDASVAWDTKGNAYVACQVFQRGASPVTNNPDQSSAVYVFRSTHSNGASWNFPGHPAIETYSTSGLPFNDKPYLTVDSHAGSPFQDRIYVTWTLFAADGTSYIYEVHSDDYGQSFSTPVVVSTTSALCANTFGAATANGTCNENQFSDPFTGPDGTLYVVYDNFNNAEASAADNHYQVLLTKSTDGGSTFSAPALVATYNDLPDCATYQGGQDPFRSCVPEKGTQTDSVFRASNYPVGQVNPTNPQNVVVTFGSYINKFSNSGNGCVPAGFATDGNPLYTGVKTPGSCNNKIVLSASTDGGTTFTGAVTDPTMLPVVPQAATQRYTDQWWQWSGFSSRGRLEVSYYDRQYGSDESTGNLDVSLSEQMPTAGNPAFITLRMTSASMPLPTEFPDSQGNSVFFGDYSGLAVAGTHAYPIWMDTRQEDLVLCPGTGAPGVPPQVCAFSEPSGLNANDQNIFTRSVSVP